MNIGLVQATHKVLEKAEYGLGLLSGGTYTTASLTTKAGLAAVARRVARNFVVGEVAEKALTPVMSAGLSLLAQANINVDPNAVRAGMLALQATGVLKKAKLRAKVLWKADPQGSAARAIKKGAMREGERQVLRHRFVALHGESALNGKNAHHMIPLEALDDPDIARAVKKASKANWDYSDPGINGAITKQYHGPHLQYNADVKEWLKNQMRLRESKGKLNTNADYATLLDDCVNHFKAKLGPDYDLLP